MPIDPQGFLDTATKLVCATPGAPESELRRGISSAYCAVFHFLIHRSLNSFISDATFRPKVARAFQHGPMKGVCERFRSAKPDGTGGFVVQEPAGAPALVISSDLKYVASMFVWLYDAREESDYDDGVTVDHAKALEAVQKADSAFQAWLSAEGEPSSAAFLQELFSRSVVKR